jgi:hypothetical protein
MALYMYQAAYTPESWAAQLKNPQNRVEAVGRQVSEAVGGKLVGGWLCFGEIRPRRHPRRAGQPRACRRSRWRSAPPGAIKASKTTVLL